MSVLSETAGLYVLPATGLSSEAKRSRVRRAFDKIQLESHYATNVHKEGSKVLILYLGRKEVVIFPEWVTVDGVNTLKFKVTAYDVDDNGAANPYYVANNLSLTDTITKVNEVFPL